MSELNAMDLQEQACSLMPPTPPQSKPAQLENNAVAVAPKPSANDYIFRRCIGEGNFSTVYLAMDIQTRQDYAIKVCEKRLILREHKQDYMHREREALRTMTNVPGFVDLYCTFQDERSLYFVMTYAKRGTMLRYINNVGKFDVACARHYAAELLLACEQMHQYDIVHRDLKPENILFDEHMHTLIADFGSAKLMTSKDRAQAIAQLYDNDDETTKYGAEQDSPDSRRRLQQEYESGRKCSFVGTAQFVSPEVLQNLLVTPAADLWALGCIIYQMISGSMPFRGRNENAIFRAILSCQLSFPTGFDKNAEDLIRSLLQKKPSHRLGAQDEFGYYESIRAHPFFDDIDWENLLIHAPPPIYASGKDCQDKDLESSPVPSDLEPGLSTLQISNLLAKELGMGNKKSLKQEGTELTEPAKPAHPFQPNDKDKKRRLEKQKATDMWHAFSEDELILKKGIINKGRHLFARKRMLLLTTGPHLIYIDPVHMIKKGEIPWSRELRVEPKTFKNFLVHTPKRSYYLEDPEGYALDWVKDIETMRKLTYSEAASEAQSPSKLKPLMTPTPSR